MNFLPSFSNPYLLPALAAASIPILIHLLNKRRFRETPWAAMQYLLAAVKKNARRIRLEQLLLLAVRTLLIAFLVAALAEPYLERAGATFLADKKTHKVIVLDGSFSMAYRPTDRSRFDRAKEVAQQILEECRKGDMASVVLMASPARVIVGEPSPNRNAVADEIDALTLPHGGADVPGTWARVRDVLHTSKPTVQKEVYFISDFQRASWLADLESEAELAQFRALAKQLDDEANLYFIDLGQTASDNLAVTDFAAEDALGSVGRSTVFRFTVRNFGRQDRAAVEAELIVDGQVEDRRPIEVAAGSETSGLFDCTFRSGGDHVVEVRLAEDPLDLDNHRWLAVPVAEYTPVVCINGRPSGEPFGAATDFLAVALAPEPSARGLHSAIQPEVLPESALLDVDLGRYEAVFLCDVGQFTESEAQVLDDYLKRGGSVLWFLGSQVNEDNYNRVLFRDGEGIFPARLAGIVGDPASRDQPFSFDPLDYAHPAVELFRGQEGSGLLTTRVYAYHRMELPEESDARIVLGYDSGDPAVVERATRRGRTVVVSTPADATWTNWPAWHSYVPMVHELLAYCLASRVSQRNLLVQQMIVEPLPTTATDVPCTVATPDGRSEPARLASQDGVNFFEFERTDTSGAYRMNLGPPVAETRSFAVNVDPQESDLVKLERDELAHELLPGVQFAYLTQPHNEQETAQLPVRHRGDLHRAILYTVLALVFVELILAWRFGHHTS